MNGNETLRISEIFFSIQGESTLAGLPCIFIRLQGCGLRCSWCDTQYALDVKGEADIYSFDEIIAAGLPEADVRRVVRLIDLSEYKRRQAAPGLKVTSKAFGMGRRIPIAQRYREG